jgi:predicted component of type VI protein secretion system
MNEDDKKLDERLKALREIALEKITDTVGNLVMDLEGDVGESAFAITAALSLSLTSLILTGIREKTSDGDRIERIFKLSNELIRCDLEQILNVNIQEVQILSQNLGDIAETTCH